MDRIRRIRKRKIDNTEDKLIDCCSSMIIITCKKMASERKKRQKRKKNIFLSSLHTYC
jgi:hypothetical protein